MFFILSNNPNVSTAGSVNNKQSFLNGKGGGGKISENVKITV